jgi:hypothetical protein
MAEVNTQLSESAPDVITLRSSADYVLCIDFDATRLLAGSVDGSVDAYEFLDQGHFRTSSSPIASPLPSQCRRSVEFDLELSGFTEIEVH